MKTPVLIAACLLLVSLAKGGGKEVLVAVGRSGAVKGELVEVRDTTLVVAVEKENEGLIVVPIRDVQWVVIKGKNHVGKAAIIGLTSGILLGAVAGANREPQARGSIFAGGSLLDGTEPAMAGAGLGALIGLALGAGVGSLGSSKDVHVTPEDSTFREVLNNAARQPFGSDLDD
jgi:hypothetical protein